MNWEGYTNLFNDIIEGKTEDKNRYNEGQVEYTALNIKRQQRWLKRLKIDDASRDFFKNLPKQHWIIITEPWCGDSAHVCPVLYLISQLNENISFEISIRDSGDLIDSYLTNGGKAIPKLIVRDEQQKDVFTYGPRPSEITKLVPGWKAELSSEDFNKNVQMWYNKDQGQSTIKDIIQLLS